LALPKVKIKRIKRKAGIYYQLNYWENGKRKRFSAGTDKREARILAEKIETELLRRKFGINEEENQQVISLNTLIDEYLISKKNVVREKSLERYKYYLNYFKSFFSKYFRDVVADISLIKSKYVKECFDSALDDWSRRTVNELRAQVKALFKYAVEEDYLTRNPISTIKKYPILEKPEEFPFTGEEINKILKAIDPFWKDYIIFLVNTGLRTGEFRNLLWDNVRFEDNLPTITIASTDDWETKTGKSWTIPLSDEALKIVKKQLDRNPVYVFSNKNGSRIGINRIYKVLKKVLEKVGLEGDVHKLRHTFASNLANKGANPQSIQKLMGHSDPKSTQIYTHISIEHLKSALDLLD